MDVKMTDLHACRVFIFQEGLVRICTTPYKKPTSKNLDCAYMHLTNYAVNKTNCDGFVAPADNKERAKPGVEEDEDSSASKWTFLQLKHHLQSQGEQSRQLVHGNMDVNLLQPLCIWTGSHCRPESALHVCVVQCLREFCEALYSVR